MNTMVHRLVGLNAAPLRTRVIKGDEIIMVGDWLTDESTGAADADATSEKILGFCKNIVNADKMNLHSRSVETGDLDGTWASTTSQFTADSTNADSGGDGVMAEYIPVLEGMQFRITLDAAKGTTVGSNKEGYYLAIDTTDASQVDESSASTSAAGCQFRIVNPLLEGSTTEVVVEVVARESSQFTMD